MKTASSPSPAVGPRLAGLRETRRWLLLLLLSIAWVFAASVGTLQWNRLTSADRLCMAVGLVCIAAGWALSRRTVGLWLLIGGPASLVLAAAVAGLSATAAAGASGTAAWIGLSVSASHVAYGGVLLSGRWLGLVWIGGAAAALALIWSRRPANVVPGPLVAAGGWIAFAAAVAATLALWFAWNALRRRAEDDDASLAALAQRTEAELAVQEHSRAWRAAAIRVHERLLSTIRYVLQSEHVDREGLIRVLDSADAVPVDDDEPTVSVMEAAFARRAADVVRLDPSISDLPLSDAVRQAVRAAVTECALNAVQHGAATDVLVSARFVDDRVLIDVTDNGTGIEPDAVPGLGWTSVLGDSLAALGGRWSVHRIADATVVTIDVPADVADVHRRGERSEDGFDQGRILMSFPLMALAMVGIAYGWVLDVSGPWAWTLWLLTLGATGVAAALVAARRHVGLRMSLPVLLAIAATPWVTAAAGPPADQVSVIAASVNAAGYAIIALGVWSGRGLMSLALVAWAVGVVALVPLLEGVPALPIIVALINCLVAVPVTLVVTRIGTRRFGAAQAAVLAEGQAARREALRANAATSVDRHLASCVTQAEAILASVAHGASLDAETRHRLACLDGLIRATIQVDPLASGGVAQAASSLVATSFSHSVPAIVGSLLCSTDPRPLPRLVVRELESTVATADRMEIRSFTAGGSDYLAIRLQGDDVHPGSVSEGPLDQVSVTALRDDDGSWTVILSRAVVTAEVATDLLG